MRRTMLIDVLPLQRLAALFDQPEPGDVVPAGWHWLYFLPDSPQSELGSDGHPARGTFMPDLPGRRMFAGASVSVRRPLRVGDTATRTSIVTDVVSKQGKSGPLNFVTVNHVITVEDEISVVEDQTLVHMQAPPASVDAGGVAPATGEILRPDPVMLFRYSAITYNAHRIHYDHQYAIDVEGYRGLVVQGPLVAQALLNLRPGASSFSFRAKAPFFVNDSVVLVDHGHSLDAYRPDGTIGLSVRI